MSKKENTIHRLEKKIEFLAAFAAQNNYTANNSLSSFSNYCEMNPNTLRSACEAGRLEITKQKKIANKFGFSLGDPAWIDLSIPPAAREWPSDEDYLGKDTLQNFRNLVVHHSSNNKFYLELGKRSKHSANMAAVSVSTTGQQKNGFDDSVQLLFSIDTKLRVLKSGLKYGFNKYILEISNDGASNLRFLQSENEITQDTDISITPRGIQEEPYWEIKSQSGPLDTTIVSQNPFCDIINLEVSEFSVLVKAQLRDESLVRETGEPIESKNKEVIISRIFCNELNLSDNESGNVTLCSQNLGISQGIK